MTTTPQRRSARVSRMPDRLEGGNTTPQKRNKAAASKTVSAFSSPKGGGNKRQKTTRRKTAARNRAQNHNVESEDESDADREPATSESAVSDSEEGDDADAERSEELEDAVASSSEEEAESSDFEEPRRGRTKARTLRKTPQKKGTQVRQARKAMHAESDETHNEGASALLEALSDETVAVAQVATDWIASYREDVDSALCELINFVFELAGSSGRISTATLYETENAAAEVETQQRHTLTALRRSGRDGADGGEVLLGKTKEQRRIRCSALQFVQRVVVDGQHHVVFGDQADDGQLSAFMEAALPWLAALSGSSFRPFRHAATLVTLAVQSALVSIRARAAREQQTAQRQLDAEQQRRRRGEAARAAQLRERVAEVAQQDSVAAAAFDALYNAVFVYRCRDVNAGIRAECLAPLATWCRAYPAAYLHTQYMRYLGWALNDKDARVREACVGAVAGPLLLGRRPDTRPGAVGSGVGALAPADASAVEGIRPFVVRFLPRLVQMAAGDVDSRVQVAALKLVTQLAVHGYLDSSADIGDIRRAKPRRTAAEPHGHAANRRTRSTYGGSLSQQMLEESSGDESESEEVSETLSIHVLCDDGGDADSAVLGCPRHSTMRVLAPLVAHTQATVRAAAAELAAWWLRSEWVSAARVAALGIDRVLDGDALRDVEDSGEKDIDDAEVIATDADVDELLTSVAGRLQARKWLFFRALGAFLWHVVRAGSDTFSSGSDDADEPEREWVQQQAAACVEEMWAAPAAAVGFATGDDQHAALAGATISGLATTALDRRISEAVAANQSAAPPRLIAAVQALWPRLSELANPVVLAEFLAWDHSAPATRRTVSACFTLAPAEETALLQAFAVSVAERNRAAADRARRSRSKKDRSDLALERGAMDRVWQVTFVSLLVRCSDCPTRLLPLMFLAVEQLDLQALFDADHADVIADIAKHAAAVLERYGANVRLARLAASFLDRVDCSRILRSAVLPDADPVATAAGELTSRAAATASAQLVAAVAAVPDASRSHDSAYADVGAHVGALRALVRIRDVSPQLAGEALPLSATGEHQPAVAVEQLFLLVELAARSLLSSTVPENVALPALDGLYHFLLWRALAFDRLLQVSAAEHEEEPSFWTRAEAEAARLRTARDRLLALCGTLLDSSASTYACLREHAFAVLGHVLRLFSGSLTRAPPDFPRQRELRRSLAVGSDYPAQAQLVEFFEKRLAAWAYLVARLSASPADSAASDASNAGDEDDLRMPATLMGTLGYYRAAPSSWSIAYSRFCALAALWAQWIGDQTVPVACLPSLAAYTGILGLEPVERRRVEALAHGSAEKAAPKRKVGFVALSAYDHIVQSAVDALRPMLVLQSTRERAMGAYVAAMRAAFDKHLDSSDASLSLLPTDPVNVATLARFVGTALRSAFLQASTAAPPTTPSRAGGQVALAPAVIGAAWTKCHIQAIDFGLARVVPNALLTSGSDPQLDDDMIDVAAREPVEDIEWETRVGPWFVALAQTVSGIIRPRHAETLDAHLKQCANKLGFGDANPSAADAEAARAAIAPYKRALDKELAKLDAIKARMAEARATDPRHVSAQLLSSPPVSPTPAARMQTMLNTHDSEPLEPMDVD